MVQATEIDTVAVSLPRQAVEALLSLHDAMTQFDSALIEAALTVSAAMPQSTGAFIRPQQTSKYEAFFLGQTIRGNRLADIFAQVIDLTHSMAPEVIEKLCNAGSHSRRLAALSPEGVHLSSPHLPTLKTRTGWFVSNNIGKQQLVAALKVLCRLSGLEYGKDIAFNPR